MDASAASSLPSRKQRDLCHIREQGPAHPLIDVCRGGLQVDRRRQVGGAGSVQKRRGNLLIHVGPRLLGGEIQSQLVGDRSKGVV